MRKLMSFVAIPVLATALIASVALAGGQSSVTATWSVAQLGQGIHGGGPLYADGTGGGRVAFSAVNGAVVYQLDVTSWADLGGGTIDLCFDVREIRGSSGLPPSFCLTDVGLVLPITGTPIRIVLNGIDTIVRATLVN